MLVALTTRPARDAPLFAMADCVRASHTALARPSGAHHKRSKKAGGGASGLFSRTSGNCVDWRGFQSTPLWLAIVAMDKTDRSVRSSSFDRCGPGLYPPSRPMKMRPLGTGRFIQSRGQASCMKETCFSVSSRSMRLVPCKACCRTVVALPPLPTGHRPAARARCGRGSVSGVERSLLVCFRRPSPAGSIGGFSGGCRQREYGRLLDNCPCCAGDVPHPARGFRSARVPPASPPSPTVIS